MQSTMMLQEASQRAPACAGGRYLNDVWTLDLDSLTWQQISTTAAPVNTDKAGTSAEPPGKEDDALLQPALPPLAGHTLVPWGTSLLCIGGHTKVCPHRG